MAITSNTRNVNAKSLIRQFMLCQAVCLLLLFPAVAQSLTVNLGNTWGGIFAGKVTNYEITLSGKRNTYALLHWRLIAKGRILSRGQQDIRFNNGEITTATLPLQAPPLKPGINLEGKLIVELTADGQSQQKARTESKFTIYGPDIFFSKRAFFRQLDIQLYDPGGTTAKVFDELKLPYELRSKNQILDPGTKGLLVVGSGVAFHPQRGFMKALLERAGAGQKILILGPVSGTFPVSGVSLDTRITPSSMFFSNDPVVQLFAKGYAWIPDASKKAYRLSLQSHRAEVLATIVEADKGSWDWVDILYGQSGGRLIVCMLPFDRYLSEGPVPQILLGRLLAYAHGQMSAFTSIKSGD